MAASIERRLKKLEAGRPNDFRERLHAMSREELERFRYLWIKQCFVALSDEEKKEYVALDWRLSDIDQIKDAPFDIDEEFQTAINKWSIHDPVYRQFASEPVWLKDRNHILSAIGYLSTAIQKIDVPDQMAEEILPLVKRMNGMRFTWGYEQPFTDAEADMLAEAMTGKDLGQYGPWFREYLQAHADLNHYYRFNVGK